MRLRIDVIRVRTGETAVLRGSPERIAWYSKGCFERAGDGEVLCCIEREVSVMPEEFLLWIELLSFAIEAGYGEIVEARFTIWMRKATYLWSLEDPSHLMISAAHMDDMLLVIPHDEPEAKTGPRIRGV